MAAPGLSTHLAVGPVRISFQRVPRVPHDAPSVPMRSHGVAPVALVSLDTALVPVGDDEGVWLGFEGESGAPCVLRVLIQAPQLQDALTGQPPEDVLSADPQNYLLLSLQHWLEGAAAGGACARPFVRVAHHDSEAAVREFRFLAAGLRQGSRPAAAGARKTQPLCRRPGFVQHALQPDPYGVDAWDGSAVAEMRVRLVSGEEYRKATGSPAPPALDPRSAYGGWRLF